MAKACAYESNQLFKFSPVIKMCLANSVGLQILCFIAIVTVMITYTLVNNDISPSSVRTFEYDIIELNGFTTPPSTEKVETTTKMLTEKIETTTKNLIEKIKTTTKIRHLKQRPKKQNCYQFPEDSNGEFLGDIQNAQVKPVFGRSIFFLMTACTKAEVFTLTARYVLGPL